jgi:serpin B
MAINKEPIDMKTQTFFTSLFLAVVLVSCNWFNPEPEPTSIQLDQKSAKVVESNNTFGFNLFETLIAKSEANKNIMISPLSVNQALSMALNGAKENTFNQMRSTMAFSDFELDDINKSNQKLVDALLNHDKKVTLQIANSIWHRNDVSPKQEFIGNNTTYYNALVSPYNPSQPEKACSEINQWVKTKTKNKISKIIDQVNPNDVMFLINAVYFKADWKTQFKKSNTAKKPFTLDNGTVTNVETMIGEIKLSYYNDQKFSVIKIPYGSEKFNMLIMLPEEGYTTKDIAPLVSSVKFDQLNKAQQVERDLWLPKFEFSYSSKLTDHLVSMGMTDAFDPNFANFKNIADLDLFISNVIHKTYIKTDEEGSEAAAATSVTFGVTSVGPTGIIKVDRSFLFAIVEEDTNSILFIGRLYDPSLKGE